ncbi:MAG TPA: HAMP domain-containing sensor histidine kinase [Candidatus Dormibacteraeota bacterium]
MTRPDQRSWPTRRFAWIDVAWAIFALLNFVAIFLIPDWETVPFHFIWVSITILYGFRVWGMTPTLWVVAVIIVLTGGGIIVDIERGAQPLDELTEVPLMAAMFFAMVWHARRRLAVMEEMRRVSEANLRLLERERRFIQNASHELRTPITVAIGHMELLRRATDPAVIKEDARVVSEELTRLARLAERLLLLAAAEDPDFLHKRPIEVEPLLVRALRRWSPTPRQWRLGATDEAVVEADAERLELAIDALIENAVKHTTPADWIELSVRRHHGVEIEVADSGAGIAPDDLERIFERFGRADASRQRDTGGMGLGLSIVKTIAEAHGGTVTARSRVGKGSAFEMVLAEASPASRYGLAEAEAAAVAEADGDGVTDGAVPILAGESNPNQ